MVNIKHFDDKKDVQPDRRQTYERPKLREFGQVGALTQAGSGPEIEMGMGNTMRQPMA